MFLLTLMLLHEIHYEYLNPGKVKALHTDNDSILVTCYEGLRKWVCPNPQRKPLAEGAEAVYQAGFFLSKRSYRLSAEEFKDPENWDS